MSDAHLQVALPWGLSHYIQLNGFHPLYRALVDHAPGNVRVISWDNASLFKTFIEDGKLRHDIVEATRQREKINRRLRQGKVAKAYLEYFWPSNQVLTEQMPGDIELHHTAPFPSMTRPFVFHCESFAPIFIPFAHQGSGKFENQAQLREHYRGIFTNPLCLGIFSHIPETLKSISCFFSDPEIDRKLFPSRMGLSAVALAGMDVDKSYPKDDARFLFMNSANQNPGNFFRRGGHIVLKFWEKYRRDGRQGMLILRCVRPCDSDLHSYGVDSEFLRAETGRSVIWAQDYLTKHEMNALMAGAHFFLVPSLSLHSVSIMQSMRLGTVPVISDTVGTEQYVRDGRTGIVLKGVRDRLWWRDPQTGIFFDRYRRLPELDADLTEQMYARVCYYLDAPTEYESLRERTLAHAKDAFCGEKFSQDFWARIATLYAEYTRHEKPCARKLGAALNESLLTTDGWQRVFESTTQPLRKLYTGAQAVYALGGSMILTPGGHNNMGGLHDWSVVAQHVSREAPPIVFAKSIEGLAGGYIPESGEDIPMRANPIVQVVARVLTPFPRLHSLASVGLKKYRRVKTHLIRRRNYVLFKYKVQCPMEPDIELVAEGIFGYNVVRFFHRYYGYPQAAGEFEPEQEIRGRYRVHPHARSAEAVTSIVVRLKRHEDQRTKKADLLVPKIEPVQEFLSGFQVVRVNDRFYATLKTTGTLNIDKLAARVYDPMFDGNSLEEVKDAIEKYGVAADNERGRAQ